MIVTANRLRSIGWIALLLLCGALLLVLSFRVNALRSQVHHAEMKIVALKQEKMYLETEFETRANQQQLKAWNDVEFGYVAPTAGQYLENERQLASLSKPAEADAPAPIRVASMDDAVVARAAFPAMVSPLSGKAVAEEKPVAKVDDEAPAKVDHAAAAASLGAKLTLLRHDVDAPAKPKAKVGDKADTKAKAKPVVKTAEAKPVKALAPAKKSVEKLAAKASAKPAAKPKAALAKAAKSPDSKATKPIRLAMKDVKTKK
ncbi:MAG: hypothetical protein RIS94_3346 [Pseudomonadota bacterium]|jgi:hypothetical protein